MHSTVRLLGGSACAGEKVPHPLSFLTNPTTDLHLPPHEYCSNGNVAGQEMQKQKKKELQKQKKRETDRRYRLNKKKMMAEIEKQLATTITENDNLKCTVEELQKEIIQLKEQLKSFDLRLETMHTELEKEIEHMRTENEFNECPSNDPNI